MKDWLFGLQLQLETSIHSGMTFPGTARGAMFASTDENKDSRVEDTCVFFTLPYFLLSEGKFPRKGTQTHPVRSLVETLYRNESPFSREFRQAVNQLDSSATSKIIYVPQVWCLIINDGMSASGYTSTPYCTKHCRICCDVCPKPTAYPPSQLHCCRCSKRIPCLCAASPALGTHVLH